MEARTPRVDVIMQYGRWTTSVKYIFANTRIFILYETSPIKFQLAIPNSGRQGQTEVPNL